ncbi:unnamed protein product [Nezara viridula]|uniref:Uncharacterized protein n=1 Tax=Nezara viridula TaxID=85310 RepID=A0A9P0E7T8_NEZVI|nr:unnamed protein product [Nezara viridula]
MPEHDPSYHNSFLLRIILYILYRYLTGRSPTLVRPIDRSSGPQLEDGPGSYCVILSWETPLGKGVGTLGYKPKLHGHGQSSSSNMFLLYRTSPRSSISKRLAIDAAQQDDSQSSSGHGSLRLVNLHHIDSTQK